MPTSKQIVVVDNGFVFVGNTTIDSKQCVITECKNIRVWGTTKGLGELRNGPTKDTVADECDSVIVPLSRVVFYLPVKKGW